MLRRTDDFTTNIRLVIKDALNVGKEVRVSQTGKVKKTRNQELENQVLDFIVSSCSTLNNNCERCYYVKKCTDIYAR